MRLRPSIVAAVLAAFVATTAVPGRQTVVHSHEDGDHDHAHASLAHEARVPHAHDDDHRHEHGRHHDHVDHEHDLRLTRADHDPLQHTHVTSPFQPATPPAPPTLASPGQVTAPPVTSPSGPAARGAGRARSRAPPPLARV